MKRTILIVLGAMCIAGIAYSAWYSYSRAIQIAEVRNCPGRFDQPAKPVMMTAPDGSLAPVYSIESCAAIVVPPSLWSLVQGRIVFEGIPERMKVNPYSLADMLLGRYTLGSANIAPCDQSATTTDCSTLPTPSQPEPQPYVPPNPVQPSTIWTSATGTPISLFGFSFELPTGWHGSVYSDAYLGSIHALVQSDSNGPGFTIDCPPAGKGLESATRLSSEARSFTTDGTNYSIAFEKWTAPGNDPWYFLWVRKLQSGDSLNGSSGTYCLAQGNATPDIEKAFRVLYESWK